MSNKYDDGNVNLNDDDINEYDAFDDMVDNHWALDLLDKPGALVAVIETKISRAVLAEQRRIIELLESLAYVDSDGHEMISEFKTDLIAHVKDVYGE